MSLLHFVKNDEDAVDQVALGFCSEFIHNTDRQKFILGRNIYADCVEKHVKVDGFIDDYTSDIKYHNLPVMRLAAISKNSLVLNVAGGRPLSAKKRLDEFGVKNLDYFAFYKYSKLPLIPIRFSEGFEDEFKSNMKKYEWIYSLLLDDASRRIFEKTVRFRLSYDITHLNGFTSKEDVQYFENFLNLRESGEVFIDVGGYDGFTSLEFMKRCPGYKSIHLFEPEKGNYQSCLERLREFKNVHCFPIGLSNSKKKLKFSIQGSASRVSDTGSVTINLDRLDDLLHCPCTFIKMDIEGEEFAAIDGARNTILTHHPRLAISIYHKIGDFWRIPKLVLSIRSDYEVFLRHYTESIYETVMFFMPKY
ncbi:FkbM family methyltransferase [Acidithiobacillus sulfurivorans]|uniref:FkbM family methyltransferase n=1 Tax=Acidithiobacillus sulfurivorans TaxID=1958756 RepID=A0ABS6A0L6_9PROT|nr:FkbM family methyltransferase [Acidithiobacillus sulfurivorans]MBU2760474.1 FkbM family methyltransferase [Acidithiobacillus sulfurivorans]